MNYKALWGQRKERTHLSWFHYILTYLPSRFSVIFGIIVIKEIVSDAVRRGGWIPRETRSEQPQLPQRSLQHGGHPSLKRMDRTMCSTVAPECSTNH
mmetsp:Transcript_28457/g.47300  ORF Transcript_28457/g.47300 Transcript_28457/m.47300 type:complete len:97 (-) Transcript_28457:2531-2821(-)